MSPELLRTGREVILCPTYSSWWKP